MFCWKSNKKWRHILLPVCRLELVLKLLSLMMNLLTQSKFICRTIMIVIEFEHIFTSGRNYWNVITLIKASWMYSKIDWKISQLMHLSYYVDRYMLLSLFSPRFVLCRQYTHSLHIYLKTVNTDRPEKGLSVSGARGKRVKQEARENLK